MSTYIHFTDEQKRRAGEVDLEQFLLRQGEKLLPSGFEKRLASDHSVTIHGNYWYDHAEEKGGGPISFMRKFYGLTYPEAVLKLLGGEQGISEKAGDCLGSPVIPLPDRQSGGGYSAGRKAGDCKGDCGRGVPGSAAALRDRRF